jgi:predicted GIY-YIG superfamily endonuclease
MKQSSSYCYLIHFESPPRGKQRHYLGYTANLSQCWSDHQAGHGSDLTKLAVKQGIRITLARVWPDGSIDMEAALKRCHHSMSELCPVCMVGFVAGVLTG